MRLHYALVDDLYSMEEFEQRVQEVMDHSGGLIDEQTAAMAVVRDAGRSHIRISRIGPASSLVCVFAKVISKRGPNTFKREDGSPGLVSVLRVGDETGEIDVVLWDETAEAVQEIAAGDVMEIVGRSPREGGRREIRALDMRLAACDIKVRDVQSDVYANRESTCDRLEVLVLALFPPREFWRRDGTAGELAEAIVGGPEGCARLVSWSPDLLEGLSSGDCVAITPVNCRLDSAGRYEYSIDAGVSITPLDRSIIIPLSSIPAVTEGSGWSVAGLIGSCSKRRTFTNRNDQRSFVRNVMISDGAASIPLVLWDAHATAALAPGEEVTIYNATARIGRNGVLELHLGRSGALVLAGNEVSEREIQGTVTHNRYGLCIDDGREAFLLSAEIPAGSEIAATGTLAGERLTAVSHRKAALDYDPILARLAEVRVLLETDGPVRPPR